MLVWSGFKGMEEKRRVRDGYEGEVGWCCSQKGCAGRVDAICCC
jgi:hypothetical protein